MATLIPFLGSIFPKVIDVENINKINNEEIRIE
jgi:hypothetical protein